LPVRYLWQPPLTVPHSYKGRRFANTAKVKSVVPLKAGILPGAASPPERAAAGSRRRAFSLKHKESLVAILIGDDAVPVVRGDESTNNI
jgi:hypothetical protein